MRIFTFLLFLFSSSLFANTYIVSAPGNNSDAVTNCWGITVGDIVQPLSLNNCSGMTWSQGNYTFTVTDSYGTDTSLYVFFTRNDGRTFRGSMIVSPTGNTCDAPMEWIEGKCLLIPDEDKPYCERSTTQEAIDAAAATCAQSEGIFSSTCNNETETMTPKCTQPESCVIGDASWPECMQDFDPTSPLNGPSSNFNPSSGTTVEKGDSFDKTEPDAVTPDASTDTGVLDAVTNMNRDLNQGMTSLDGNLTQGFADLNTALNNIDAKEQAIGESIVEQLNQDYEIFQAQKDLQLQTTGAIQAYGSQTAAAVTGTTSAVNNATSAINDNTSAIGELGDRLEAKMDELKPCEPTADNNYCQGPNGLDQHQVTDMMTQMIDAADAQFDIADASLLESAQNLVDTPLTGEVEGYIQDMIDTGLGVLPDIGDCSPLAFPLPGGSYVNISCEASVRVKAYLSFFFYLFTAWSLTSILLNEVTPAPGTKPYGKR